jgi:tetratricopeptide (TPR) repeat protein
MFWRKPAVPAIKDSKETPSRPAAPKEESAKKQPEVVKKVESKPSQEFVVEDAEDDEDEEEAEEEEANGVEDAELEALKTKYEDANRLATKYINGQMHAKAIEKLTEALELAPKIPNASKDIATLYNNRSAMYEKMEAYDKSLSDITVLLAMDTNHLKARVRRARIYEAQVTIRLSPCKACILRHLYHVASSTGQDEARSR